MTEVGSEGDDGEAVAAGGSPTLAASSWRQAVGIGLGAFGYFAVLTVWLPSRVLELGAVESLDAWVQDLIVTAVWGVPLVLGLAALRVAQRRGWI